MFILKKPNIVINKVYTRRGDSGKTELIDQKKVLKSDIRIDCYGEIDELNSSKLQLVSQK